MKAPSKEIHGKSMQGTNGEKYIQWVTTLSLTMRVYLHSFSCCCLQNLKFSENSNLYSSRSTKVINLGPIQSTYAAFY